MAKWVCTGFERNADGVCQIIWECQKCGHEVAWGLLPPEEPCPACKKREERKEKKKNGESA